MCRLCLDNNSCTEFMSETAMSRGMEFFKGSKVSMFSYTVVQSFVTTFISNTPSVGLIPNLNK